MLLALRFLLAIARTACNIFAIQEMMNELVTFNIWLLFFYQGANMWNSFVFILIQHTSTCVRSLYTLNFYFVLLKLFQTNIFKNPILKTQNSFWYVGMHMICIAWKMVLITSGSHISQNFFLPTLHPKFLRNALRSVFP